MNVLPYLTRTYRKGERVVPARLAARRYTVYTVHAPGLV